MLRVSESQHRSVEDSAPADAVEFQKVRLSDSPPTEEPVCPKGGPPQEWFKQYAVHERLRSVQMLGTWSIEKGKGTQCQLLCKLRSVVANSETGGS